MRITWVTFMDLSTGDISSMVFRRIVRDDLGGISLDRKALMVLMELDGNVRLGVLARKMSMNMGTMRDVIANLMQLGLVENVSLEIVAVDKDFFRFLLEQLSLAVGPVAGVLIEDEVQNFGYDLLHFPCDQAAALVDKLALEIRREEKKSAFLQNMAKKILEKGYSRR